MVATTVRRYTWLSYPLSLDGPLPPGIPSPEIKQLYSVEEHEANVHLLICANHTGTHVDAPRHVFAEGTGITDFAPEELIFVAPVVINLRLEDADIVEPGHLMPWVEKLGNADIAILRFGRGHIRRSEPERFACQSPGFGREAARWLRINCPNLRALGTDLPSVICIPRVEETKYAHHELLGGRSSRFLILEDMNLEHDLDGLMELHLHPWMVLGLDSSPCSIVGVTPGGFK